MLADGNIESTPTTPSLKVAEGPNRSCRDNAVPAVRKREGRQSQDGENITQFSMRRIKKYPGETFALVPIPESGCIAGLGDEVTGQAGTWEGFQDQVTREKGMMNKKQVAPALGNPIS
jgi:hypothetical protein